MKDWISVWDRLPEGGQKIIGLAEPTGGTWHETFDKDEPLGFMTHWLPLKELNDR